MVYRTSDNNFGTAKWIVDPTAGQGTHTTIATALTSAASGDTIFIRPGTYTENLTLKAGVNLTSYVSDSLNGNVTIIGKATFTAAGTVDITGIRLQTNSDFFLAVTGNAASIVTLNSCYLNCTNNTGISYTSSSGSSAINIINSRADLTTSGITFFTASGSGQMVIEYTDFLNSGVSTTASTTSACPVYLIYCLMLSPITTSGTGSLQITWSSIQSSGNVTAFTHGGSTTSSIQSSVFAGGSASAISISTGCTVLSVLATVNSTNTNAITGAGTFSSSNTTFIGTGIINNTTTQNIVPSTAFQRVNIQTFTGSGTYTPTTGMKYCIIECQGSGGGSGGTATSSASFYAGGGGGGGGGYSRKFATSTTIGASQTVTIGTAGTAGTSGNNAGGAGGDTSLGAICIGKGGSGGSGGPGTGAVNGGAGGVAGTGDFTVPGGAGGASSYANLSSVVSMTAVGGNGVLGQGGTSITGNGANRQGNAGSNYGGGGGGNISFNAGGALAGNAGAAGIVIITEYI